MKPRRGVTVLESVMACLLMAVAVSLVAELMVAVARQQRICRQRDVALQEASNALELALAPNAAGADAPVENAPAADATVADAPLENAPGPSLSEPARAVLSQAELDVSRFGQRVVITVRWNAVGAGGAQQVRLVGWRFAPLEEKP